MATRFSFSFLQPAPATPSSWSAGWNKTTGTTSRKLFANPPVFESSGDFQNTGTGTSGNFIAIARHISDPLTAQTISGNVKGQIKCRETATTDNYTLAFAIKVIQPDGTDRGTLLAVSASDDTSTTPPEFSTGTNGVNRKFRDASEAASIAVSSLGVSLGDRIVVELGFRQASTSTATGELSDVVANGEGSYLPEDETTATAGNAWLEFDTNIKFAAYHYGSVSNPADNGSLNEPGPHAVTPPTGMLTGDLVVLVAQMDSNDIVATLNNAGGQSWADLTSGGAIQNGTFAKVWWCQFDGTWDANPAVDFNAVGGTHPTTVVMHVFRPPTTDSTWSVNQSFTELDIAAAATQTITGQTTTGTDPTVTLAGWFTNDDNTWGSLSGTGWEVTGAAQYRNTAGGDQSCTFAHKIQTAAGATGNVSKTQLTLGNDAATTFIVTFAAAVPNNNPNISPGLGSLVITGLTPSIFLLDPKAVTTGLGQLAITGHAPTLTVSDNVNVSAGLGALTLTGFAPTPVATENVFITAGAGALTITGYEPTVSKHIETALGTLTLTGHAPTVSLGSSVSITSGLGELLLTGLAPTVAKTDNVFITPDAGALSITGQQPTVQTTAHVSVNTQTGALVITGYQPSVASDANVAITTALGQLMLSGHIPSVDVTGQVTPPETGTGSGGYYRYLHPNDIYGCEREIKALEKKQKEVEKKIVVLERKVDDKREEIAYAQTMAAIQRKIAELKEIQRKLEIMRQKLDEMEQEEMMLIALVCQEYEQRLN